MSIKTKAIRIKEIVARGNRVPRRLALTDFPRNWEVAKEVRDWSSALDFIDKYADRAKEWWKQLIDRLNHDDYNTPASLIDKALGAIPLPANRRFRRADVDRSKISEVRKAVKKEFPNLKFTIREVGFHDLARASRYFFSASNWDSPATFKRVEEIVKSIAPEIIVSEGGVIMSPDPAGRRGRESRGGINMENRLTKRGDEEEPGMSLFDDLYQDQLDEKYKQLEKECETAADKVQDAIIEAIKYMEDALVDMAEQVIDDLETEMDRTLTADEKSVIKERMTDDIKDIASQFSTAEYDFHSAVAYWHPRW